MNDTLSTGDTAMASDHATIEAAQQHALTADGRTFGAWVRGGGRSKEQMRGLLVDAGYAWSTEAKRWESAGYRADLLRRPHGDIDIMVMVADEPVLYATGPGGYLPPQDRPSL